MMKLGKRIGTALAVVLCAVLLAVSAGAADLTKAEAKAAELKGLGLFRGVSDTDFDLNREPTRVEALVMLIRTLGEEQAALGGTFTHPFTDVPQWANNYVGYAYQKGLTNGVSATEFGSGNASAAMYVTFMLRALGYSDAAGDFKWDNPFDLARKAGIVTSEVDLSKFLRADVVEVSYAALSAKLKDGSKTLSERLIAAGVFPADKLKTAGLGGVTEVGTASGPVQIFKPEPIYEIPPQPEDPAIDE